MRACVRACVRVFWCHKYVISYLLYSRICLSQKQTSRTFFSAFRPKLLFVLLILERISRISTKSNMFSPFHTRISQSQASQVHFIVECPQFLTQLPARYKLCNINLLGRWRLYVIVFASVRKQLRFGLSCKCFITIEGSQIIAFWHTRS